MAAQFLKQTNVHAFSFLILTSLLFLTSCVKGGSDRPMPGSTATSIVSVAGGNGFTLALKRDGTILAWGDNSTGQLGDGSTTDRITPVNVVGLTDVTAVVVGVDMGYVSGRGHVMALKTDGSVWAWGDNMFGELGDGSNTNRAIPVKLVGIDNVIALAAGDLHSVALKSDGTVWTWGYNQYGQLGNGDRADQSTPQKVSGLSNIVAITAGIFYSAALKSDGTVWVWGGGLGDLTAANSAIPTQVQGLTDVIKIYSNMIMKGDGTAWYLSSPLAQIAGVTDVTAISVGAGHSMALKSDGSVLMWGSNQFGQLGDGTVEDRINPAPVIGVNDVTSIAAGSYHTVILKKDDTVWEWGLKSSGPVLVAGLTDITQISTTNRHNLALRSDGAVMSWGANYYGQLGDGTTMGRITPWHVSGVTDAIAVSAGEDHSVALKKDGAAWAWGLNAYGQVGDGTTTDRYTPVQVKGLDQLVAIEARGFHTIALRGDGTVWTWGDNRSGQRGNGTKNDEYTRTTDLVQVGGLANVVAVAAGVSHSMALTTDGTVWTWGSNQFGQLGDSTNQDRTTPVQVKALSNVTSIAAGAFHTLVVQSDGTVWGWGDNSSGQLGDDAPTILFTPTPTPVKAVKAAGLTDVVTMAAGSWHSIALMKNGTLLAWGHNLWGQLGDGSKINRGSPVLVAGIADVKSISGGYADTLALRRDGTVWSWGFISADRMEIFGLTP